MKKSLGPHLLLQLICNINLVFAQESELDLCEIRKVNHTNLILQGLSSHLFQ